MLHENIMKTINYEKTYSSDCRYVARLVMQALNDYYVHRVGIEQVNFEHLLIDYDSICKILDENMYHGIVTFWWMCSDEETYMNFNYRFPLVDFDNWCLEIDVDYELQRIEIKYIWEV